MKRIGTAVFFLLVATLAAAQEAGGPKATAQALCDDLIQVMKDGPKLGYDGRLKQLDPELRTVFDLPFMTRLVVGPTWRTMSPGDRQALVDAFSDYSIAVYASEFKSFGNDHFAVDPNAVPSSSGDTVVKTKFYPGSGDPVELDYLVRNESGAWKIIDVFLNGTISQMAARRSEYSSTLRAGGPQALAKLLKDKTAELAK